MSRVSGREQESRSRWGDVEGVGSATRRERLAYAGSVESDARRRSWCTATRCEHPVREWQPTSSLDLTTYHLGPVSGGAITATAELLSRPWRPVQTLRGPRRRSRRCTGSAPVAASRTCRAPAGSSRLARRPIRTRAAAPGHRTEPRGVVTSLLIEASAEGTGWRHWVSSPSRLGGLDARLKRGHHVDDLGLLRHARGRRRTRPPRSQPSEPPSREPARPPDRRCRRTTPSGEFRSP
jgi:hypothetical protein